MAHPRAQEIRELLGNMGLETYYDYTGAAFNEWIEGVKSEFGKGRLDKRLDTQFFGSGDPLNDVGTYTRDALRATFRAEHQLESVTRGLAAAQAVIQLLKGQIVSLGAEPVDPFDKLVPFNTKEFVESVKQVFPDFAENVDKLLEAKTAGVDPEDPFGEYEPETVDFDFSYTTDDYGANFYICSVYRYDPHLIRKEVCRHEFDPKRIIQLGCDKCRVFRWRQAATAQRDELYGKKQLEESRAS